jgi:cytochrome b561
MRAAPHLRYDPVAVTLHWVIAFSIIAMIPLGFFMGDLPISIRFDGYAVHKSLGLTVLALSIFRLIERNHAGEGGETAGKFLACLLGRE